MKKILIYDDYNRVLPPPEKQDVIGTIRPQFSRLAHNGWKIIEVYEEDNSV